MHAGKLSARSLEVLRDDQGEVSFGWIGKVTFYARYEGGLSASIGLAYAIRLREMLTGVSALHYFSDATQLGHHDLVAESAFVRTVVGNRGKFRSLVVLTQPARSVPAAEAFATAVGEPITLLSDASRFEGRLVAAAPWQIAHRRPFVLEPK
jgi:hypothetical protein